MQQKLCTEYRFRQRLPVRERGTCSPSTPPRGRAAESPLLGASNAGGGPEAAEEAKELNPSASVGAVDDPDRNWREPPLLSAMLLVGPTDPARAGVRERVRE